MNRLPDWLQDVGGFPASNQKEENDSREALVAAYESFRGEPIDQLLVPADPEGSEQPALVSVPRDLMDSVARFVAAREEGSRNVRERDSAAVLGEVGVYSPALGPWRQARKFFMSCTHLDLHYGVEEEIGVLPSRAAVLGHVDSVEAALRVRLGQFFDSYEEIEDIVSSANELDDKETGET
jgi:hypothetical protein